MKNIQQIVKILKASILFKETQLSKLYLSFKHNQLEICTLLKDIEELKIKIEHYENLLFVLSKLKEGRTLHETG